VWRKAFAKYGGRTLFWHTWTGPFFRGHCQGESRTGPSFRLDIYVSPLPHTFTTLCFCINTPSNPAGSKMTNAFMTNAFIPNNFLSKVWEMEWM